MEDTILRFTAFMDEMGDFPDKQEFVNFVQEAKDGDDLKLQALRQYMDDSEGENPLLEKGIYTLVDIFESLEDNEAG